MKKTPWLLVITLAVLAGLVFAGRQYLDPSQNLDAKGQNNKHLTSVLVETAAVT